MSQDLCVPKTLSVLIRGGNHLTSADNDRAAVFVGIARVSELSGAGNPEGGRPSAERYRRGSGNWKASRPMMARGARPLCSLVRIESAGGAHETGGAVLFDAFQQIHFP